MQVWSYFGTWYYKRFQNFGFTAIFGLRKSKKIVSVHTKMVIFTKVVAWFVFIVVYWFVNPIGTWCHCRNTGSGVEPQPGWCFCISFELPHIHSGHILNALRILFFFRFSWFFFCICFTCVFEMLLLIWVYLAHMNSVQKFTLKISVACFENFAAACYRHHI